MRHICGAILSEHAGGDAPRCHVRVYAKGKLCPKHSPDSNFCGAATRDGKVCNHIVGSPGQLCSAHGGGKPRPTHQQSLEGMRQECARLAVAVERLAVAVARISA